MNKRIFIAYLFTLLFFFNVNAQDAHLAPNRSVTIIGGGIVGVLESYYAYQEAKQQGEKISIMVYEKGDPFIRLNSNKNSTNTSLNIVPSLTIDEILSVVPRGAQLMEKLAILFSEPGGIRVDDVEGVNDGDCATKFKEAVSAYGLDINHDDRTLALLMLGKKSMDLWQEIYEKGDAELKEIFEASNYNPCRQPKNNSGKILHDGYRIDLIYGVFDAEKRALSMKADYEKLGYENCTILSPDEVKEIDPSLADFCDQNSENLNGNGPIWKEGVAALWRPGGCIDTREFVPRLYGYLKKSMGTYTNVEGEEKDCFQIVFNKEVVAVESIKKFDHLQIVGLKFNDGTQSLQNGDDLDATYVFCPGESVGTLKNLGFHEPAYAGFAGSSLILNIPVTPNEREKYKNFSHCMEVHNEGIVLAWQGRLKEEGIFIGVAGTKAFYGDKQPDKNGAFAKNRNLVQLNMINDVLPNIVSLAFGYDTYGKTLSWEDLDDLENRKIAQRWVGRRSVAYDGFPTIGPLYSEGLKVVNGRCTTHLGSGGVSFGPGAVVMSRSFDQSIDDPLYEKILKYGNSNR